MNATVTPIKASKSAPAKAPAAKALSKSALVAAVALKANMTQKEVSAVYDALSAVVGEQLSPQGPGVVSLTGLVKIRAVAKPAQAEKQGINPFTKAKITIAAKPASRKVKVSPSKALKEAVGSLRLWAST